MDYRITGLPAAQFAELQRATDDELRRCGVERHHVDEPNSAPCRISLQTGSFELQSLDSMLRKLVVADR